MHNSANNPANLKHTRKFSYSHYTIAMDDYIVIMMNTWILDRTYVIKFSLFPFAIQSLSCKKRNQNLRVLVR